MNQGLECLSLKTITEYDLSPGEGTPQTRPSLHESQEWTAHSRSAQREQVVRDFLGPGDWSLKIDGQSEGMNRNIFMEFPARTEGTITIGSVLPQYLEHYNTYVDIHRNCYI